MAPSEGATRHDCTTLGGNSGSVVLNLSTGEAVGLHFAGLYQETNYAVRASVLRNYVDRRSWNQPLVVATQPNRPHPRPNQQGVAQTLQVSKPVSSAAPAGAVTVT